MPHLEKIRYHLQPPERERAFLASRIVADKLRMKRVYLLALCIIPTFLLAGLIVRPPSPELTLVTAFRVLGIVVALAGLWALRKAEDRRAFEWTAFACLAWLSVQIGIVQWLSLAHSETILAWTIFVVFLVYLTVPIGLRFRLTCAIFLSVVSIVIWSYKEEGSHELLNGIGLVSVYLASNFFGIICASNAARTEREEFLHLESEKELKSKLELALAHLEESVESRNQIYQVLAHDLRNGISAMGSIGGLLAEGENYSEKERMEMVQLICNSSQSSYDLLDNLLQWAISQTESTDSQPEVISLVQAASSCVGLLTVLAREKKIDLEVAIDPAIQVWADSRMLETVIRNLASNAIKFTQSEGTVRVSATEGAEGLIVVSITDNGVGIDPERLSRIFNLKHDEGSCGTSGEGGTNLGLRICLEFVKKMGGEIWASSEVAKGTQFNFSVPAEDVTGGEGKM